MIRARRTRGTYRASIVIILGALLLSFAGSLIPPSQPTAAALGHVSEMTPDQVAESFALYYGIVGCLKDINDISNSEVIGGGTSKHSVGSWYLDSLIGDGGDGVVECKTAEQAAVDLWGYGTFDDMLAAWGYKNPGNGGDWHNNNPENNIKNDIKNQVYSGSEPTFPANAQYVYYRSSLVTICKISSPVDYATASSSLKSAADSTNGEYVKVTEPTPDYKSVVDKIYKVGDNKIERNIFPDETPRQYDHLQNCVDLAANTSKNASAFQKWAVTNVDLAKKISQTANINVAAETKGTNTCSPEIGAIGWIVCPVMNFMARINDGFFTFVAEKFLAVRVELFNDKSGTFIAWTVFRNYANVAFVLVFLVIIYSQVTGAGITNYGIKRMLPKLIISAVLVNISFYLCQAAVDLSNLMGFGIKSLFDAVPAAKAGGTTIPQWATVVGGILIGVGAVAGLTILILAVSSSVLIAAFLAFAMIVLILVARQALIVMLIVVSPLAFVANMLPNTEGLYKKWVSTFKTVLFVFPVISLVFGASMLAAKVINSAAGANPNTEDTILLQLTAMAITAIPLFMVPTLLKGSMAAAGSIGNKLGGYADRSNKKIGGAVREKSYAGAYMKQRSKIRGSKRLQKFNDGAVYGRISRSGLSGQAGTELGAMGTAMASKEEREAVDNEAVRLQKQKGWTEANRLENARETFKDAMKSGDTTKARAAQQILLSGGNKGISELQNAYTDIGNSSSDEEYGKLMNDSIGQKVLSDLNGAGIKGKNASLAQMAYTKPVDEATGKKRTVADIATDAGTYSALTDAELAGQSEDNLRNASISATRAQSIINNQNVWSQLSDNKKQIIQGYAAAAGGTPSPQPSGNQATPAGGNPAPTPPPTGGQGGGTPPPAPTNPTNPPQLNIPHGPAPNKGSSGTNTYTPPTNPGGTP